MKKNKKKNRIIFHQLAILALLSFTILNTSSILSQEIYTATSLVEITPENVQDLELLHWFGQGTFTGGIAQQENGNILATATSAGIVLMDKSDGSQINFIPIGLQPTAIAISPDGENLAAVVNYPTGELGDFEGLPKYNRQIQLYTLSENPEKIKVIQDLGECADSNIWDITFSSDGRYLIFERKYSLDKEDRFCSLSLDDEKVTGTLEMGQNNFMAISHKGNFVAAMQPSNDKVSVYNSADFSLAYEFSTPASDYPALFFSPSGRALAVRSANDDQEEFRVWSLQKNKLIYSGGPALPKDQETDQNDSVMSFEITPDEKTIYLGTQMGKVIVLDVASGEIEKQLGSFTWTNYTLTGNPGGATAYETSAMVKTILLSADEKTLIASEDLTTYGQSGSIHGFKMPAGEEFFNVQGSLLANTEYSNFAFSVDSSRIAHAGANDGRVEVYDLQNGQTVMELIGHTQLVNQVIFSPDGNLIATCSNDKTIRLWDAQTGNLIRTLSGHQNRVNQIAFSPDSSWIVSGADDNTLRRWDVNDGTLLETLELSDENWRVYFLDTLNDNQSVVYQIAKYPSPYIGYIQEQILWDISNNDKKAIGGSNVTITQFANEKAFFAGYSNSGRIVGELNNDGSIQIKATFRSPYGNGALVTPTVAPNHRLVISGNGFGLHAWELNDAGIEFIGLAAGSQPVPSYGNVYKFSPDGKYLAYTSGGAVYVMGVPAE